jgi:hypothetical protein
LWNGFRTRVPSVGRSWYPAVSVTSVFGHDRLHTSDEPNIRSWREPGMSARTVFTSAVVALIVVVAYDQYKQRKG